MTHFRVMRIVAPAIVFLSMTSGTWATAGEEEAPPPSPVSAPQNHIDLAKFVQMPSVRRELKLSEAQIKELAAIEEEMKKHIHGLIRQIQTLDGEERKAAMQEIQDELSVSRKLCAAVFSPDQRSRVQQLAFQFISRGAPNGFGLLGKAMMKDLKITDDQANLIRERSAAIDKQLKTRDAEMKAELETLRIKLQTELIDSLEPAQKGRAKESFGELIPLGE